VRRTVASRAVTTSGTTSTWNYGGTTVTDPLGNDTVHNFGVVCAMDAGGTQVYGCTDSSYEMQVKYYQGSSSTGTLLRTVNKDYVADRSPLARSAINARLIRETIILDNGQTKKTETDYETFAATYQGAGETVTYTATRLNPTEVREYDYGSGGSGSLL